jgi:hypothetical protein
MQSTLIAGDSLKLLKSSSDYPASAGWTMKLRLVPRIAGPAAVVITAGAQGDDYLLQAPGSVTKDWAAGQYSWARWVENVGGDAHTLDQGQLTILPDPRTATAGTDTRSQAAKALESALQALATFRESKGLKRRFKIGEREMEFTATEEILREIRFWQRRVDDEEIAAGRKSRRAGVIKARL